jgi:hypothetical protein
MLAEVGEHGLKDFGQHWGGGAIVEIDSSHGIPLLIPFYPADGLI